MRNISDIFPANYPHPCSEEDLLFDLQEILRHADSPVDIIHSISKIDCPYYRKAIATLVPSYWHSMEQLGKEPAVFLDAEGDWRITWMNVDHDMRAIIKTANAQQLQLEYPNPSTPSTPYILHTTPKNNTTMPLFINRHEGTINHNEYHNCTINYGVEPTTTQLQPTANQNDLPSAPDLLCLDRHSISVIERKIKEAIEVPTKTKACANLYALQREGYINLDQYRSDEERAHALNRYQTTHIFCADDIQRGRSKR